MKQTTVRELRELLDTIPDEAIVTVYEGESNCINFYHPHTMEGWYIDTPNEPIENKYADYI